MFESISQIKNNWWVENIKKDIFFCFLSKIVCRSNFNKHLIAVYFKFYKNYLSVVSDQATSLLSS